MGLANIGIPSLILIVVLALIIFGPSKLPEIGKAAGQTIREFKSSTADLLSDGDDQAKSETTKNDNSSGDQL